MVQESTLEINVFTHLQIIVIKHGHKVWNHGLEKVFYYYHKLTYHYLRKQIIKCLIECKVDLYVQNLDELTPLDVKVNPKQNKQTRNVEIWDYSMQCWGIRMNSTYCKIKHLFMISNWKINMTYPCARTHTRHTCTPIYRCTQHTRTHITHTQKYRDAHGRTNTHADAYAHAHTHAHRCTHARTHKIHTQMHTRTHAHAHARMHTQPQTHTNACTHSFVNELWRQGKEMLFLSS